MSTLLRINRCLRTSNPLQTSGLFRSSPNRPTNFFTPSLAPKSSPSTLPLQHHRLYASRPFRRPNPSSYNNSYAPLSIDHTSTNNTILYALLGLNISVFAYATYVKQQAKQGYPAPFARFVRNFTLNYTDVLPNGVWWPLLTSCFTHIDVWHLAGNMFTAFYLGRFLCSAPIITPQRFLTITLGSGLAGGLGFLVNRGYMSNQQWGPGKGIDRQRGMGFSGALMGITSAAACLAPSAKVYLYGIVPLPLWAIVGGYAFYDGYYVNSSNTHIAHAGHLGGLAFGIGYYFLRLRGLSF